MWTLYEYRQLNGREKLYTGFGLIAFPVDDPAYYDSDEGGLSVFLLIFPELGCKSQQPYSYDHNHDSAAVHLMGVDVAVLEDWEEQALFPLPDPALRASTIWRGGSRPLTACLKLGSTNWSGRHRETHAPFRADWEHLTPEGKALVDALSAVYLLHNFVLVTVLDT